MDNKLVWALLTAASIFCIIVGFRNFGIATTYPVTANWRFDNFVRYAWIGLGGLGLLAHSKLMILYANEFQE